MAKPIDVRKTIATVIADMRASGDTGMVENLLEADAAIANLIRQSNLALALISPSDYPATFARLREALARVSGGAK